MRRRRSAVAGGGLQRLSISPLVRRVLPLDVRLQRQVQSREKVAGQYRARTSRAEAGRRPER